MEDMFANLDEETKAKAQEILSQMNDGTITREDAEAQLAELGVELPQGRDGGGFNTDMFADLDDETKAKAQEIMSQMDGGTITREDAEAQLAELGVTLPERPDRTAE
jgi:hypothetical protein